MNSAAFITSVPVHVRHATTPRTTALRPSTFVARPVTYVARPSPPARFQTRMLSPQAARTAIAVYGVVIAGGGVGAFLKSGSKPSIISGVTSGLVLAAAYTRNSVPLAMWTAVALAVVFGIRLAKTNKFMPAGMLCIASVAAAALFASSIYG